MCAYLDCANTLRSIHRLNASTRAQLVARMLQDSVPFETYLSVLRVIETQSGIESAIRAYRYNEWYRSLNEYQQRIVNTDGFDLNRMERMFSGANQSFRHDM